MPTDKPMTIEEWAQWFIGKCISGKYRVDLDEFHANLRAFADEVKAECKKAIVQPNDGPNLAYSREAVFEAIDSVNMEG